MGMLLLAITALFTHRNEDYPVVWVSLPLFLLSINLFCAIITNQRFRKQRGLLVFHIGLFAIITLAAAGVMTSLEARLEITEGQAFDAADVEIVHQGPWHNSKLDEIDFIQGPVRIDFVSGFRRGETYSQILQAGRPGNFSTDTIGDKYAYIASGYRFITTGNKGYSAILSWYGDEGDIITGAVNFPPYPAYEWRQDNEWLSPQGQPLGLTLKLADRDRSVSAEPWTMESRTTEAQLHIKTNDFDKLLGPGESIKLEKGVLRFDQVRMWMGYRIDYNPVLNMIFLAAFISILGLGFHIRHKFRKPEFMLENRICSINSDPPVNA